MSQSGVWPGLASISKVSWPGGSQLSTFGPFRSPQARLTGQSTAWHSKHASPASPSTHTTDRLLATTPQPTTGLDPLPLASISPIETCSIDRSISFVPGRRHDTVAAMVNLGNVLQGYLAATQQMLSGDQLNNTKIAITTYTLPALPYVYNVSRPMRCPNAPTAPRANILVAPALTPSDTHLGPGALHLWGDHGDSPRKAPPGIRDQPQRRRPGPRCCRHSR